MRRRPTLAVIEQAFAEGADRFGFRLAHYSILANHVHLLTEASDRNALSHGMQGLPVRAAKALNKHWRRKGSVFADRYHARQLRTPREVRSALIYVLHNARHHGVHVVGVDEYSSAPRFDGWACEIAAAARASPGAPARTWLLRTGWRRDGLIGPHESPQRMPP